MTAAELLDAINDNILSGGRRTTAFNTRGVLAAMVAGMLNLQDGGQVIAQETGYTSNAIVLTQDTSFTYKKWVEEYVAAHGGTGITDLTGDVTASGTGSVAATLATVNPNVYGSNTLLKFKVNGKGLVTGAAPVVAGDIPDLSATYLTVSAYNAGQHFRGKYATLIALQTAVPTGNDGDYAVVDAGIGSDAQTYIWDSSEGWVLSSGSGGLITSVFGRTGVVVATAGDYNIAQITNGTPIADAYIASASTWNGKQNALTGTGYVISTSGTISYDNSVFYKVGAQTLSANDKLGSSNNVSWDLVANNLPVLRVSPVASGTAIHYLTVTSAATGNPVLIGTAGATDVSLRLSPSGSGSVLTGNLSFNTNTIASSSSLLFTSSSATQFTVNNNNFSVGTGNNGAISFASILASSTNSLNSFTVSAGNGNGTGTHNAVRVTGTLNNPNASGIYNGLIFEQSITAFAGQFSNIYSNLSDTTNRAHIRHVGTAVSIHLGSISIGTTSNPNSSSILDLVSTSKGLLIPRWTTAQQSAIASPVAGLMAYNTDTRRLVTYNTSTSVFDQYITSLSYDYAFPFVNSSIGGTSSGNAMCTPYIPSTNITVSKLRVYCNSFSGAQTIYIGIYNAALTTSLGYASVSVSATGFAQVTLSTPITLTAGTFYYLVFEDAAASGNNFAQRIDASGFGKSLYVGGPLGGNLSTATAASSIIYIDVLT